MRAEVYFGFFDVEHDPMATKDSSALEGNNFGRSHSKYISSVHFKCTHGLMCEPAYDAKIEQQRTTAYSTLHYLSTCINDFLPSCQQPAKRSIKK